MALAMSVMIKITVAEVSLGMTGGHETSVQETGISELAIEELWCGNDCRDRG